MKAERAFKILGFEKQVIGDEIIFYKQENGKYQEVVFFYLDNKTYDNSATTSRALHLAIDLQMQELGWLDIKRIIYYN